MHDFNSEFSAPTPGIAVLTERYAELLATDELIVLLAGGEPDGFAQLRFRPSVISGALDATLEELYVAPPRRAGWSRPSAARGGDGRLPGGRRNRDRAQYR